MSAGAVGIDHPAASVCHTVSAPRSRWMTFLEVAAHVPRLPRHARMLGTAAAEDLVQATLARKCVVKGKRVYVSVHIGGCRIIKNKTITPHRYPQSYKI